MASKLLALLAILVSTPAIAGSSSDAQLQAGSVRHGSGVLYFPSVTPTASRACRIDSTGAINSSSVTDTELGFLSGVTSAIQTQLNAHTTAIAGKEPSLGNP